MSTNYHYYNPKLVSTLSKMMLQTYPKPNPFAAKIYEDIHAQIFKQQFAKKLFKSPLQQCTMAAIIYFNCTLQINRVCKCLDPQLLNIHKICTLFCIEDISILCGTRAKGLMGCTRVSAKDSMSRNFKPNCEMQTKLLE